jgi:hypothetical protein
VLEALVEAIGLAKISILNFVSPFFPGRDLFGLMPIKTLTQQSNEPESSAKVAVSKSNDIALNEKQFHLAKKVVYHVIPYTEMGIGVKSA